MEVHSQTRKLLTPLAVSSTGASSANQTVLRSPFNSLEANVVLVLAILLCGVICALVLNAIVRCVLRISDRVCYVTDQPGPIVRPTKARFARKEAIRALPTLIYSAGLELGLAGTGSECAICLSEFARGEHVRVLPACNHGFHVRCIDRWLAANSSCPTCRQCLEVSRAGSARSVQMDPEGIMVQERGQT